EAVVARHAGVRLPGNADRLLAEPIEPRQPHEVPLRGGAHVDQDRLGVLFQQRPGFRRTQVARIAFAHRLASWLRARPNSGQGSLGRAAPGATALYTGTRIDLAAFPLKPGGNSPRPRSEWSDAGGSRRPVPT